MQLYPAMRAHMGDWDYFIVRMTMREVAREVQLASDLWEDKTLSDAIQRVVDESRVKQQIVNFLSRRDDRFFSSLVVAAIGGNPTWAPITLSRFNNTFGELSFENDPRYYALDGQHRLKAIQELMADLAGAPPGFPEEQLSVIVVLREHQNVEDDLWLQRYRRLFSSLNRYAKPTDADTNIIMDEDDIFAIVTRRLITDHKFFRSTSPEKQTFRVLTKGKPLKPETPYFTSLQTLYKMNRVLLMTSERRQQKGHPKDLKFFLQFRPEEIEIDQYFEEVSKLWDAILLALPVLNENPERMRNHILPDPNPDDFQDHLLFWPIGQELFVDLVRSLLDRDRLDDSAEVSRFQDALRPLADIPWALHEAPWRYLLLVPDSPNEEGWRMRNEDRKPALELARRLLRWIAGLDSLTENETDHLRTDWRNLLYPEPPHEDPIEEMWKRTADARAGILGL